MCWDLADMGELCINGNFEWNQKTRKREFIMNTLVNQIFDIESNWDVFNLNHG